MIRVLKALAARQVMLWRNDHLVIAPGAQVYRSRFGKHVDLGPRSTVLFSAAGDYTYVGTGTQIMHSEVGKFCSIAGEVHIGAGSHPSRGTITTHPALYLSKPDRGWSFVDADRFAEYEPTTVGNDVWLGAKVVVRGGITVGDGVIVGAGSIVTKSLEPYGVYVGSPARLLRFRFSESNIADLLAFRWWDKDEAWLRQHAELFLNPDRFHEMIANGAAAD